MCAGGRPLGTSLHSLQLCLTEFKLLFRERMQTCQSSDRSIKIQYFCANIRDFLKQTDSYFDPKSFTRGVEQISLMMREI